MRRKIKQDVGSFQKRLQILKSLRHDILQMIEQFCQMTFYISFTEPQASKKKKKKKKRTGRHFQLTRKPQ